MHTSPPVAQPVAIVVCGPSGVGKSLIGQLLATTCHVPFIEGDDYHSAANVTKMRAGVALTDADRQPWLERLRTVVIEPSVQQRRESLVLACSALKRAYRDTLRGGVEGGDVFFVLLSGDAEVISARVRSRQNHFMPVSLLASQLRTLEPLDLMREHGMVVNLAKAPEEIVKEVQQRLSQAARL